MGFTKEAVRNRDVLIESRERNTFMSKELQIRNSTVDFLVFTRDAGENGIEVRVQLERYYAENVLIKEEFYEKKMNVIDV